MRAVDNTFISGGWGGGAYLHIFSCARPYSMKIDFQKKSVEYLHK